MKQMFVYIVSMMPLMGVSSIHTNDLAVASFLVHSIMSSPEWEDKVTVDGTGDGILPKFQSYDDLFSVEFPSNHIGFLLSPAERKNAFEKFISAIPELITNADFDFLGHLSNSNRL